jgi:cytochrome P450
MTAHSNDQPPLLRRKGASLRLRLRALLGRGGLPNAIIIGAMKSGTTSLFDYLIQHPDVCGSRTKELHFFDNQYAKGERWYRANFAPRGQRVLLESSPYYLFHPLAAERAARLVPQARLIVLLRNPVDRAYSHFNQNAEEGLEPLSFEEALERETERLAGSEEALAEGRIARSHAHQTFSYVGKGLYAAQLQRWLGCFARERMLILKAEDLFAAPQLCVDRVTDFLGLERFRIADPTPGNQRRYPLMHPDTRRRLEGVFEAPNETLAELTGIRWPRTPEGAAPQPGDIDLASPHLLRAPWPAYEALRAQGPAVWLPRQRFWLVTGHGAVREALERPDLFSSEPYRAFDPVLAGADPPGHARGRAFAAQAFAAPAIERATAAAEQAVELRLHTATEGVGGLAAPAAKAAVAALLGIPAERIVPSGGDFVALAAVLDQAAPHAEAYRAWIGSGASPPLAASLFRTLWLAGAVTLERSIAWALFELLQAPELGRELATDPALLPGFVEEVLRLHPPTHMAARRTTGEAELGGVRIPAGEAVQLCFSAANRDPAVFAEPDQIDLRRAGGGHLSFGSGPHACMGAALARRILPAVVRRLVEAEPEALEGDSTVEFLESIEALAPARLPMRLRRPG